MKGEKTVVNILWTGGWDSTFRMIQLAEKDIIIQPFYLKDNRPSEQHELNAIHTITEEIRASDSTLCTINELKTMNTRDVEVDGDISEAYDVLLKRHYFGSQYDWLARFAKNINNLELTIHVDDKAFFIINTYGKVIRVSDDDKGEYYILDPVASPVELVKLFGNYHFPILNYTKLEMRKVAEEKGLIDLMHKTWFCQKPINNQPCGACNPCIYAIEEGMGYRLSNAAFKRYKARKIKDAYEKVITKTGVLYIWRLFKKIVKFLIHTFRQVVQRAGNQ